jgi:hypothetical protein
VKGRCYSYCSHGGICVLDAGHVGLHDSAYCKWPDAQALTREAADALLAQKPGGAEVLALQDLLLPLLEAIGDDEP